MSGDRTYVTENAAERERLRALAERMSDDDLRRPLADGWTVAATLAHIAFWDQRGLALLERWERQGVGPSPLPADVDAVNDATRALCLAIPPRAAAELAVVTAEAIDRKLERLTPEMLAQMEAAGSPLGLKRATHRREHLDEIERLLKG
jgi:hypothetical protein